MGYTRTAAKGVSWIGLLRVATRIITILRLSILGRILTPAQFGYFGIASLVLALLEVLTETGINVFLVQEKKSINEYINSAWVVSIFRGAILAIIIILVAPLIVTFFNAPGAYETLVLMAIVPFIRGFINPAIITYQKELLFDKEFKLRFILFAIDVLVSIVAAFITKSAVAFVYGLLASALLEVILSYALIPLWPKLQFELKKVKLVIKRGWWVTLTGLFSYVAENGDNIAAGKLLGTSALGIYQVAYKLSTLPISEITNVVNQVIFPVYSKFADDKGRVWKAFLKVTTASTLSAFVLGGAVFFFAEPIILIAMGPQWIDAIPVVKILAIYAIIRTIFGNFAPLFLSLGKQNYVAQMTFVRVLGLLIVITPLITQFGLVGAGYAMLISIIVEIPIIFYFTLKIFKPRKKITVV